MKLIESSLSKILGNIFESFKGSEGVFKPLENAHQFMVFKRWNERVLMIKKKEEFLLAPTSTLSQFFSILLSFTDSQVPPKLVDDK